MLLTVGRVIRPHGVRGEVLVEVSTDEPAERYVAGAEFVTEAPPAGRPARGARPIVDQVPARLRVETVRPHQGRLLVGFAGFADRDTAKLLRGVRLQVDSDEIAAPADPDEFHDHQLVGLPVVTTAGEPVGEVERIDHAPAADLLVVGRPEGSPALVPFVRAIVPEVDVAGGRIVIDPPPGLLEL